MQKTCVIHTGKITEILKLGKLKITPIRLKLMDALEHAKEPVRAKDLVKQVKSDIVTVYRNLETLNRLGLVSQVFLDQKEAYFELKSGHHHHAICENCGKVSDIHDLGHKKLDEEVKLGIFPNISSAINAALKKAYAKKSRTYLKWLMKKEDITEAAMLKENETLRK